MRTDRLLKLADFLDTLPAHKFNFAVFTEIGTEGKSMEESFANLDHDCGTVGCAIGWMPQVFKDEGVTWWRRAAADALPWVQFEGKRNFAAAEEFFALPHERRVYDNRQCAAVYYLFEPDLSSLGYSATPAQVAAHIRKFVSKYGAEA